MKKNIWTTFLALTVILAACGLPATPPPVLTESTAAPTQGLVLSDSVIASAKVLPARDTQMSFVISAPVQEVFVKEGESVKEGQVLLKLYSPDLELAVTSAELEVKSAELEFAYWIPARHDRPPERRQQAEAELEYAKAKLETAKANFMQASITAPFDAVVVDINVQAGEFAQAGKVVITLADVAHMQIQTTDLSERDLPAVKTGQSANVYIEALDVSVAGKVIRISPVSETVGGDVVYPVTIELMDQPDGMLWGMTAEVEISVK